MGDPRIEKGYELLLKGRQANIEKSVSIPKPGVSFRDALPKRASTLSDVIKTMGEKGHSINNLESTLKTTSEYVNNLRSNKGSSKVLPALGIGAAALAGISIANKVQAGEYGQAGMEAADVATDYVPGIGQLKFALSPSEMGNAELPPDVMEERRLANEQNNEDSIDSEENPIIQQIINSNMEDIRGESNLKPRSEYVTAQPEKSDIKKMLEYNAFKESSNKPWQVNASNPSKPTTGYHHIEQPTYVENIKEKYGADEARKIASLSSSDYIRYVQSHKDEEEEVAKREIQKKHDKWGDKPVVDNNGKTVPAWRAAYTFGDAGFKRFLKNTKQDINNE